MLIGGDAALGDYGEVFDVAHCDGCGRERLGVQTVMVGVESGRGRRGEGRRLDESFTILDRGDESGT